MHRILYPKYGPIPDVVSARNRGSSSWKLICNGGKFLNPIIRKSISNGKSISVLHDTWILDKCLMKWPTFINPLIEQDSTVDKFIPNETWNISELKKVFGEELVLLISDMEINFDFEEDRTELIHKLFGKMITGLASEAMENGISIGNSLVWFSKAKLNPKVKLFWWRIFNNTIPTNKFLCYRRLLGFDKCPRGCEEVEDLDHIVRGYRKLYEVFDIMNHMGFCFPAFASVENCYRSLDKQCLWMINIFCNTIYLSWRARNQFVHEKKAPTPLFTASEAVSYKTTFRNHLCSNLGFKDVNQPTRLFNSWLPPPPDWIKVNIDAALHNSYKAGMGGVFRDHHGRLLLAFVCNLIHWDSGALELQAITYLKNIFKDWMLEYKGLIIEEDNKNVINLIKKEMDANFFFTAFSFTCNFLATGSAEDAALFVSQTKIQVSMATKKVDALEERLEGDRAKTKRWER
ncbi:uncharacterized protein LOC110106420 [Dendrobium catenatum]|uniref:uncharacterized protein LOC110106420 n=1 Tax=Dendrobium catenatum TaxID=906689 RepID=UPI0009F5D2EE|nr:uncharacterized protein LOC110106420 [Dendrobium catenatum]